MTMASYSRTCAALVDDWVSSVAFICCRSCIRCRRLGAIPVRPTFHHFMRRDDPMGGLLMGSLATDAIFWQRLDRLRYPTRGGHSEYRKCSATRQGWSKGIGGCDASRKRRCFRAVDSISEQASKLIAINEKTDDQIVHRCRFQKTNRATYEPLNPRTQVDVLALNFLRMLLANVVLFRVDMPLICPPSIGVKPRDPKRALC